MRWHMGCDFFPGNFLANDRKSQCTMRWGLAIQHHRFAVNGIDHLAPYTGLTFELLHKVGNVHCRTTIRHGLH